MYIDHIFLTHPSFDGHLDSFHVSHANNAAVDMGPVHRPFLCRAVWFYLNFPVQEPHLQRCRMGVKFCC